MATAAACAIWEYVHGKRLRENVQSNVLQILKLQLRRFVLLAQLIASEVLHIILLVIKFYIRRIRFSREIIQ